jgi:hypothetical protein
MTLRATGGNVGRPPKRVFGTQGNLPKPTMTVFGTRGRLPELAMTVFVARGRLPELAMTVFVTRGRLPEPAMTVFVAWGRLPEPATPVFVTCLRHLSPKKIVFAAQGRLPKPVTTPFGTLRSLPKLAILPQSLARISYPVSEAETHGILRDPVARSRYARRMTYTTRGGARIGWMNYSWPLASLSVDKSNLTIVTTFFGLFEAGRYSFRPDQVIRIEKYGWLPIIGEGVRIHHTIAGYPEMVVFWCRPTGVLQGIASTGFPTIPECAAPIGSIPSRGFPLRIWPLVIVFLLWNLFLGYEYFSRPISEAFPGPFTIAALCLLSITSLAVLFSPAVQAIFIRPGRSIGEVRPLFVFVATISGIASVAFTVIFLAGGIHRSQPRPNKALPTHSTITK